MEYSCHAPIGCFITTKVYFSSHFFKLFCNWQHAFLQPTQCILQFTVSNNGTQWTLDFGPDSVVLSVKDLDENLRISSLELQLAAWSLLLSQREVLDNHLPRVPITPSQQGTFEMREEVLSSVGAQDTDTSGYELSDLKDHEFSWKYPAVDMGSVYWPGIDTPISLSIFDDFQMG